MKIKYSNTFLLAVFVILFSSSGLAAAEFHFWPTPIRIADPETSGVLFEWPDYEVILQTKDNATYTPAKISDELADQFTKTFALEEDSPIMVYQNKDRGEWGFRIPGGFRLRRENLKLLPAMEMHFSNCLSTLSEEDLIAVEEVLLSPLSFLGADGVKLTDTHKAIAKTLQANFQANRCKDRVSEISDLLRERIRSFLSVILSDSEITRDSFVGRQLVLTQLFHDLLFSTNGLWVRTTLGLIKEFVEKRLLSSPVVKDKTSIERDYDSFIDFVLMSKDTSGLTKESYLTIADATGISSIIDIFNDFPLNQLVSNGNLIVINLHIGTHQSTLFFKGTKS